MSSHVIGGRWIGLLALTWGLVACSGDAGPTDAAPDAAPADGGESDGGPGDAGVPLDAEHDVEDTGADAGRSSCGEVPDAPAWLEGDAHRRIVRTDTRDVHVWLFDDGIARLRYVAPGSTPIERSFAVDTSALGAAEVAVGTTGDVVHLCTDTLEVTVSRAGGLVVARDRHGVVLAEDIDEGTPTTPRRVARRSPTDELILGLGEKTGPLDRRGRRYVMRNTDAYDTRWGGYGPNEDPLYLSIPFHLGVRGNAAYGVLTDVAWRLTYDVAASHTERVTIESEGPEIDQWLFVGPTPREVIARHSALTGRTPQPPRWALGFHQSRWGYHDTARMERLADDFRRRRIPADVLWLDIQHMDGFRTFTFDPVRFADPEGLAAHLAARNFRLVVIADPGLKIDDDWPIYRRVMAEGLALMDASGQVHVDNAWPGRSVFLDYSLPAARELWAEEIAKLAERGIGGIWLDVNEPTTFPESGGETTVPDSLPVHGDGVPTTMGELHNVYANLQARATYEGLARARPNERPFILCRAGYSGIQRYAAIWTGDAPSTWWSLEQVLPMLLGMSISGVPFVGSDVGGYSGNASPELYARWMTLGAWSPFFRGHVTNGVPDQEPWSFGIEVEDISASTIAERYAWLPYFESLFDEHVRTGLPPLRPLVLELFDEPALRRIDDQAMIGPWLMIAPVTGEGATRSSVRIPSGRWYEASSGAVWEGPATIELDVTLAAMPLFVREGAILPRGVGAIQSANDTFEALRFELYPSDNETSFTFYEDAGDGEAFARTPIHLVGTANGARVTFGARAGSYAPLARPVTLRVWRVEDAPRGVQIGGRTLTAAADVDALALVSEGWAHDPNQRTLHVKLAGLPTEATIEIDYDRELVELRPAVEVVLEVTLPEGTPEGPVTVASSANGWTHQPLERLSPTLARGVLTVPRGEWFFYKYTRGDWETVEKWPGCEEATNRYAFGRASTRQEQVFEWRDQCE